jgi:hypothetical protein
MFILGRINRIEKAVKHHHGVTQKFVGGKKMPPIISSSAALSAAIAFCRRKLRGLILFWTK